MSKKEAQLSTGERGRRRDSSSSHGFNNVHHIEASSISGENEHAEYDRGIGALHHIRSRTRSRTGEIIVKWGPDDPENPYNWSNLKKTWVLVITAFLVVNSTMGSSLPSMAMPEIAAAFNVTSDQELVLPISVYLIGYVFGPLIWGPLSEHYGRRIPTLITFVAFLLFTLACAVAPNWPALLVFRTFCGIFASSPIAIVAGVLADIYDDPQTRGRAFAIFMVMTVWGPLIAPIVSGFTSPTIGWRWSFWIALMFSGITLVLALLLPETFGPILLSRRAAVLRKQSSPDDPNHQALAPRDLESTSLSNLVIVVLMRPLNMTFTEPIVSTSCAYLALVYAVLYMSFTAYPIIFQDLYGLSGGVTGLTYLPIMGGVCIAMPTFWGWDAYLRKAAAQGRPWTKREEYRRLPLACIGGPSFVISLFWLGFSAKASVPFAVPMLAGIPFGYGYILIFMAILNYLTDAYEIYAASANAAASTCRALLAVVMPLATSKMFSDLGIAGACSLLGGLSAVMCIIPWIFIWKGPTIRAKSKFCMALKEKKAETQQREELERQREESERQRKEHTSEIDKV